MAIENLLNRIELGNRFTRAIAVGNPREFSAGDKEEQEIAETCNRLIKNAIVCWNYLLLEHRLNQASTDELRAEIRAAVANHSVISWGVIAHPTPAIGSAGSLTASTKRMVSNTEARLAFAVLTTERKAA